MPPIEPIDDSNDEMLLSGANEEATPVDTAKDGEEDAQDEAAWAAHKQALQDECEFGEEEVATLVDMQHMHAE